MKVIKDLSYSKEIFRFCSWRFASHIYRGCPYACAYCYAKFIHKHYHKNVFYFETFVKDFKNDIIKFRELNTPINLGSISDEYQPVEKHLKLTRQILEILVENEVPFYIVTKSDLVLRDIDILKEASKKNKCLVQITITTINEEKAKLLEPYAPPPSVRLETIKNLHREGIPVLLRLDPVIPLITDDADEIELLIKEVKNYVVQVNSSTMELTKDVKKDMDNILKKLRIPEEKFYKLFSNSRDLRKPILRVREDIAYDILSKISSICKKYNVSFMTCKEGFFDLDTDIRCCYYRELDANYYPTIRDTFTVIKSKKGELVSFDEIKEYLIKNFKIINHKYLERLKSYWNSGKLFEGISKIERNIKDGEVFYYFNEKSN